MSCATAASCKICDQMGSVERAQCYQAGCACFGSTVYAQAECTGAVKEQKRDAYGCQQLNTNLALPIDTLVTMTVYDFDTGPAGDYVEEFTAPGIAYYRAPLQPASGDEIGSTIRVSQDGSTFTSTAVGDSSDNPTDPRSLTNAQAANGVQLFYRASQGFIEGTYAVRSQTAGCTGRNLLFAGDSSLCTPPPPMPPPPPSVQLQGFDPRH